ncbi:adenylyltransferase and sulfurtransferase MOCS3 [Bombus terrestris]|uniref:Adenylyltransferase and sulfurtransferase MOCS3 homolog n=1 Tax=Bombus terrestris TaxID=30195 RepID=A0A9C6VYF2_BOMTE|nr:adenylyltransferase and sulfurtransferase MOCS3 [Bombus terrestris]XP_012169458.1 adenylyltransferase and sulfurtransferase MOCS3 [Bombus terrestris]XP_012169464.1 adenylyltransferase and sulfurtransferase MOCS3 [Bombus terrestris]XP_012169476.1 adenylyltransferase and sulfurtransferase MOCS3 [Bombus terrestris]XP_012169483.1 adenylyltransferase and sulfurtransferase MOCS3 [Bombus terrestris]XP_012169484.1 adenylyltransferase and sulfurtransferase MOCS3 [Bombus terrestris]XP_048261104.1 ad
MNEKKLIDEIIELRELLRTKETQLAALRREKQILQDYGLNNEEILRYSRQIFLPEIAIKGQVKLKNSAILIVGAGGLGCPAALYLASAGVGQIGIIDYDDVEINNLHRQLLYAETSIGTPKVNTAAESLNRLNSDIKVTPYKIQLDSSNALDIIKCYDVVVDATDNVATRYLLNDACVLSNKPLVSGSALKFEGHLSVFNYNGPCYRCIFPKPPPPETVTNCGDGGVFGPAVGTIGVLQALEALKIVLDLPHVLSGQLLLFDGLETKFRKINLRAKNINCAVCGKHPTLHKLIDYEQFCGAKANDKDPKLNLLRTEERISVEEYNTTLKLGTKAHILIDVRSAEEFDICHLKHSINIPLCDINNNETVTLIRSRIQEIQKQHDNASLYVMCRRGNDSQKAVKSLQEIFQGSNLEIKDVIGGIHAWSKKIDCTFPVY